MRKKTAKNTNFRENLSSFDTSPQHDQEKTGYPEKEFLEKLESFAKTGVEYANLVKQALGAEEPQTHFMYVPQRPSTQQDLLDLEERLTAKKSKKPDKALIVLIFEQKAHTLFRKDSPDKRHSLARAPLREKILGAIRPEFQKTAILARDLRSTEKSIRSTIDKINEKAMKELTLKEKIILGEGNAGYRLNPLYSLSKK